MGDMIVSKRIITAAVLAAFMAAPAVAAEDSEKPKIVTVNLGEGCPEGYSAGGAYVSRDNHTVNVRLPVKVDCMLDEMES